VNWRTVLAAAVGAGLLIWLLLNAGLSSVISSVVTLGLFGFVVLAVFQLGLAGIAGYAWALLGSGRPDARLWPFVWSRLVRDAASQALPFTQVGGIALGGRALALEGVAGHFAVASTLTDMAVEFTTQIAYAALGAGLLADLRPASPFGRPVLALIAGLTLLAAGLVYAQSHGAHLVERLARRLSGRQSEDGEGLPIAEALAAMRSRPWLVAGAWSLHLAAWVLTGVQTWITLRLLHVDVSLGGALVVDSLTSAAKAVAFMIPGSLGIQEGALVLLGQLFGVPPAAALALSLVRRGRDLALALPILGLWQLQHGARIWGQGEPKGG